MKKILFLHGFYASGQCVPAVALREAFEGEADVITPDLPMHPKEAVKFIRGLIDSEKPGLLIGNSCGSFYAQIVAPVVGAPALLGNPLIEEFAELEAIQFNNCNPDFKDRIWGLFGEKDTLAHFEPTFLKYYNKSFHFLGGHTPTADDVRTWYVPLAKNLLKSI